MSTTVTLREIYDHLFAAYGPQHWWPGQSPFEVMIGAILVQNTSWKNVEKAIDQLRRDDLLEPHALRGRAAGGIGGVDPPGRLLPHQGPAPAQLAGVRGRAVRWRSGRDVRHRRVDASRGAAGGQRRRTGDGRLDPAVRRGPADVRDRHLHAPRHGPARLDRARDRLPRPSGAFREPPGGGRGDVQRVSRLAGPRRPSIIAARRPSATAARWPSCCPTADRSCPEPNDMSLFDASEEANRREAQPLAARMRPATLDEFVGQRALSRRGEAAAPAAGGRPARLGDLLRPARHRQDDAGPAAGRRPAAATSASSAR